MERVILNAMKVRILANNAQPCKAAFFSPMAKIEKLRLVNLWKPIYARSPHNNAQQSIFSKLIHAQSKLILIESPRKSILN
ncbi:hypothetical protein IAD21_02038 [Abditibacteriota bacterium]|nr:hypothetical protein IAD21_02038 [Abditibacteriota bacterium]